MSNWAILIGINKYSYLPHLKYAKADAEAMKEWLEQEAGFDHIFLFTEDSPPIPALPPIPSNPTFGHLDAFFHVQFQNSFLQPEDNLWIFFSGHGMRGNSGDYLMLCDSNPGRLDKTAIAINYITERLRNSGAGNVVMFIDACRNEAINGARGIEHTIEAEKYQRIITFYSCSSGERSYEIEQLQKGTFTHVLLETLRRGNKECITVQRLENYLKYQVPILNNQYSKPIQNPLARIEPIDARYVILSGNPQEEDIKHLKETIYKIKNQDLRLAEFLLNQLSNYDPLLANIIRDDLDEWKKNQRKRWIIGIRVSGAVIGAAIIFGFPIITSILNNCPQGQTMIDKVCTDLSNRFSSGERFFLESDDKLALGNNSFKQGNYQDASNFFQEAVNNDKTNPEPQIYYNNAQARKKGNPFVLAVVISSDGLGLYSEASEVLRGVADAQTKFNSKNGLNDRLLEIVIVNDSNDPKIVPAISQKINKIPNILGVIGHYSSETTKEAIPEYEKSSLAMISPASTTDDLSSPTSSIFFRTVIDNKILAKTLSEYVKDPKNNIHKIAIFYSTNSNYSKNIYDDFKDEIEKEQVIESIDIQDLNSEAKIKELQSKVDAIVLFPKAEAAALDKSISIAGSITKLNSSSKKQIKLLGSDSLYRSETLNKNTNTKGLVLVVPWFPADTAYAKQAEQRWEGKQQISWPTATSYDATKAFIHALSANATRASVLEKLKDEKFNLPANETSGEELKFSNGNRRNMNPVLVQVIKSGSQWKFEQIK